MAVSPLISYVLSILDKKKKLKKATAVFLMHKVKFQTSAVREGSVIFLELFYVVQKSNIINYHKCH